MFSSKTFVVQVPCSEQDEFLGSIANLKIMIYACIISYHIYLCICTSIYIYTYEYQHLDLASCLIVGSLVSKCLRSESQRRLWKKLEDQFQAPAGSKSKPQAGLSPKSPHHSEQENTSLHKYYPIISMTLIDFDKFPILRLHRWPKALESLSKL